VGVIAGALQLRPEQRPDVIAEVGSSSKQLHKGLGVEACCLITSSITHTCSSLHLQLQQAQQPPCDLWCI
jgi:hypothetical protein